MERGIAAGVTGDVNTAGFEWRVEYRHGRAFADSRAGSGDLDRLWGLRCGHRDPVTEGVRDRGPFFEGDGDEEGGDLGGANLGESRAGAAYFDHAGDFRGTEVADGPLPGEHPDPGNAEGQTGHVLEGDGLEQVLLVVRTLDRPDDWSILADDQRREGLMPKPA